MAKKKKDPWGIEEDLVKKEAAKSVKKAVKQEPYDFNEGRKQLKIYAETHRRLKYLALDDDMQIIDYIDKMVNERWERRQK